MIPALGIEQMLEQGVPQSTLDKVAPGVKTQDVDKLFGALDRAIPGLGEAVRENANAGVTAGLAAIGQEATLEGKKARSFPLRFVDGAVFIGPLKVAQTPPLF
jgi:Zn-dependent M32 family carboxypeptidase